jgi:hypothetical protein
MTMKLNTPEQVLLHDAAVKAVETWRNETKVKLQVLFGEGDPMEALKASDQFNAAMQRLSETLQ